MTTLISSDTASSYLLLLDELEGGELSLAGAREFPGQVAMFARRGQVFIADDESPTVTRFDVGSGGELSGDARLSFAPYGLSSVAYGLNFPVRADRAYVSLDARERIVWDPSAMEIVGTLALELPAAPEGFDANASYDRGMVVRDDNVYQSVYMANWDEFRFAPASQIAVWNTTSDAPIGVVTAPCPMLDAATRDDGGYIYYSSWLHSIAANLTQEGEPSPCAVRIAPGANAIDEAWTRNLGDYTGGRPAINLQFIGDGLFVASVFDIERTTAPIDTDQVFSANWQLWSFDLEAGSAAPVEGIEWNDGGYSLHRFDGRTYVLVTTQDSATTIGYALGPGAVATEAFRVAGAGYQIGLLE